MDIFGLVFDSIKGIVVDNITGIVVGSVATITAHAMFGILWDAYRPLVDLIKFSTKKANEMGLRTRKYLIGKLGTDNAKKVIEELDTGSESIQDAFSAGIKGRSIDK